LKKLHLEVRKKKKKKRLNAIGLQDRRKTTQNLSQDSLCPSVLRFEADICQLHVRGLTAEPMCAMPGVCVCIGFVTAWPAGHVP
jgi:hypothetical protein